MSPCPMTLYTVHGIPQATVLEWGAFPFSRGSSQARDRTQVSRIAGGFFTSWATREARIYSIHIPLPLGRPSTPTSHPSGSSQSPEPGSLCHAAASHWPPILPTVVYICQCYLLNSSHPPHPHCGQMSILYAFVIYCFQWGNQNCAAVPKSQEPPWDESI